ncbi:MAG TPA: hypothetical protein VFB02_13760 [Bradyrhizobium sp.]|nr:hypothetical protein [Bradyrhizobium sp.]
MGDVISFPAERQFKPARQGDLVVLCIDGPNDLWAVFRVTGTDRHGRILYVYRDGRDTALECVSKRRDCYVARASDLAATTYLSLRGRVFTSLTTARLAIDAFRYGGRV